MDQLDLSCNSVYSELALITLPLHAGDDNTKGFPAGARQLTPGYAQVTRGFNLLRVDNMTGTTHLSSYGLVIDRCLNDCSVIYCKTVNWVHKIKP